jgi:hypothetical protein
MGTAGVADLSLVLVIDHEPVDILAVEPSPGPSITRSAVPWNTDIKTKNIKRLIQKLDF